MILRSDVRLEIYKACMVQATAIYAAHIENLSTIDTLMPEEVEGSIKSVASLTSQLYDITVENLLGKRPEIPSPATRDKPSNI